MRAAQTLLATLTQLVPPIAPAGHGLTLEDGTGYLRISILDVIGWRHFVLEPHDLDKNPEELANEVARLLKEPKFEEKADAASTVSVPGQSEAESG